MDGSDGPGFSLPGGLGGFGGFGKFLRKALGGGEGVLVNEVTLTDENDRKKCDDIRRKMIEMTELQKKVARLDKEKDLLLEDMFDRGSALLGYANSTEVHLDEKMMRLDHKDYKVLLYKKEEEESNE